MPITVQRKTGYFNELAPEPAIRSCDPGQLIPCFDSCQLTIMWMSILKLQFQILARKCDISNWFSCGADGWADGGTGRRTYGQVTTKIFLMHWITKFYYHGSGSKKFSWNFVTPY